MIVTGTDNKTMMILQTTALVLSIIVSGYTIYNIQNNNKK